MASEGPRRSRRLATQQVQQAASSGAAAPAEPAKPRRRSIKRQPQQDADAAESAAQQASAPAADGEPADLDQPRKRPRGRPRKATAAGEGAAVVAQAAAAPAEPADAGNALASAGDQQSKSQRQQQQSAGKADQSSNSSSSSRARKAAAKPKARGRASAAAAAGPSRAAEEALWAKGYQLVAGVDEAGRGPLAGPVVAAAAILPRDAVFPLLNDSKQLNEEQRELLYVALTGHPGVTWAVSVVDHETIDEINILQAAMLAMTQAVEGLAEKPHHLLIDGNRTPAGLAHMPLQLLVKGDATSSCIAAASIIAKVTRDRLMLDLDKQFPQYGFAQHKGYGVPAHRAAIQQHGPCDIHRRSFEPVKSMTGWTGYGQKAKAAAAAAAAAAGSSRAVCMA